MSLILIVVEDMDFVSSACRLSELFHLGLMEAKKLLLRTIGGAAIPAGYKCQWMTNVYDPRFASSTFTNPSTFHDSVTSLDASFFGRKEAELKLTLRIMQQFDDPGFPKTGLNASFAKVCDKSGLKISVPSNVSVVLHVFIVIALSRREQVFC